MEATPAEQAFVAALALELVVAGVRADVVDVVAAAWTTTSSRRLR
ncbi:hypothetical protein ACT8ZV_09610 [Nocardioides sp. MAHUQ-72]